MDDFVTRSGHQQLPDFKQGRAGKSNSLQRREPTGPPDLGAENPSLLQLPRYYIKSLAETIQHIAVNNLSFPGSGDLKPVRKKTEVEEVSPDDLFTLFVLYNTKKDERLKAIVEGLPASTSYTSPDIPNKVSSVLESMVLEEIASLYKTSEANFFCVKANEICDADEDRHLSVVVRFVKDGRPAEHLVGLRAFSRLTEDQVSDLLLQVLTDRGFNPEQLIAQCYDGPSIVSGRSGGVQKKIQDKLGKTIPYVHCNSHQLHLVIVNACCQIKLVKDFFGICNFLYNFTRRDLVNQLDSGSQLKGLIDRKGTGPMAAARAISENFGEVLTCLSNLADPYGEGARLPDWRYKVLGLLSICAETKFVFLALLMKDLLSVLEPGSAALQDKDLYLGKAAEVVSACVSLLKERRSQADALFEELLGKASEICEQNDVAVEMDEREVRQQTEKRFKGFIAEGRVGTSCGTSSYTRLKQVFLDVHDCSISEAETRFSGRNAEYLSALDSLVPGSDSFLDVEAVKPLLQLVHADEYDFALEANLLKRNILAPTNPLLKEENSIRNALAVLFSYKSDFPNVYRVLAAAVTFGTSPAVISGASTTTPESTFSCLTHVLQSPSLSMSHLQRSSLVLLGYENKLTNKINMEAFLDKFSAQSHRLLV